MDISSEMIHAVLPLFMAVGLGASATAIGITEGAAESVAAHHEGLFRHDL